MAGFQRADSQEKRSGNDLHEHQRNVRTKKRLPERGLPVPGMRVFFQEIYERYHRAEYISPDPLEFLYLYEDPLDREIVGMIASSLAYGRVAQILKSVASVLKAMGPSPRGFLEEASETSVREAFRGFKHRFTTDRELADLLLGIRDVIRKHGSLQACFLAGISPRDEDVLPALSVFVRELGMRGCGDYNSLISIPEKKSACKRLNLFLRWMTRSDEIDPGCWTCVSPAKLIVPLDTHMYRICTVLGMTSRSQADMRTAREITDGFKKIDKSDPVRYDFSLTRLGIRKVGELSSLVGRYTGRTA